MDKWMHGWTLNDIWLGQKSNRKSSLSTLGENQGLKDGGYYFLGII